MSFPRYERYKESGVEWLGEVPVGWEVKPVKTVSTCNDDVLEDSTPVDYEIEYVEISGVNADRGIMETTTIPLGAAPSRARRRVKDGDVIVSMVRTYLRAIAPVIQPAENMIVSTGFAVVRPRSVQSSFLGYLFRSEFMISGVIARSVGVSYPAINASELIRLKVPVPPLPEQHTITAFLDRETGKIDALVAEQERLIGLLKEKRQATISYAVTKGLNPDAPMKDSGIEWLGAVPVGWEVVRLKFVATVQTGLAKGKVYADKTMMDVPFLRVANVQDGYLDLEEMAIIEIPIEDLERYSLRIGDVLMNEGGDFDKLGRGHVWQGEIETCIHQNHVFAVRPIGISPEWLNKITGSDYAQFYFMTRSKQSTNLASISSTNIMDLPVVLPSTEEQSAITTFLDSETTKIDALVGEARQAIGLLKERRSALISAAVTGKIEITVSDRSDLSDLSEGLSQTVGKNDVRDEKSNPDECDLEDALTQTRIDLAKASFVKGSAEEHISRLKAML